MYTYLLLNLLTLLFPLLFSFEKKVRFFNKWKYALPAILISAVYFLIWDYFFTSHGIWSFNSRYLIHIFIGGLPLEEILFFICVPYACLFIYAVLKDYLLKDRTFVSFNAYLIPVIIFLTITGILCWKQTYTAVTSLSTAALLALLIFRIKANYLFVFFIMYVIHLLPFLVVNGILTALPVVSYNNDYNSGIRIGTIPIEDTIYSLLLLLMNVAIYEGLQNNDKSKSSGSLT